MLPLWRKAGTALTEPCGGAAVRARHATRQPFWIFLHLSSLPSLATFKGFLFIKFESLFNRLFGSKWNYKNPPRGSLSLNKVSPRWLRRFCGFCERQPNSLLNLMGPKGSETRAVSTRCQAWTHRNKDRVKYRLRAFYCLFKVGQCYGVIRLIMSV